MKNVTKIAGIIAMVAVMALAVSCSKNEASSGTNGGSAASAGKASPAEDFGYDFVDDEIHITYYNGTSETVIIPADIDGFPVTSIGGGAFWPRYFDDDSAVRDRAPNLDRIKTIVVPDSVTTIGSSAFSRMENLTSLTLLQSLAAIPFSMCFNSANLSEIKNIPASTEFTVWPTGSIWRDSETDKTYPRGNYAFLGCGKLSPSTRKQLQDMGYKEGFGSI